MEEIFKYVAQFGISGIFFVMWYIERRDNKTIQEITNKYQETATKSNNLSDELMIVVKENTEAITRLTSVIASNGSCLKMDTSQRPPLQSLSRG